MAWRFLTAAAAALLVPAALAAAPATGAGDAVHGVEQAIDEARLSDAAHLLDRALLAYPQAPQLEALSGELALARQRPAEALARFRQAATVPATHDRALAGEGLALAALGRETEAQPLLEQATAARPQDWRAWNALGVTYDDARRWPQAESAYAKALAAAASHRATVLNNRGYSRLLQNRLDDAAADLLAALQLQPGMAEARANLRLVIALRGDYQRATAGAPVGEAAAVLNNAGFAAALRGDYAAADQLLSQAALAKGEYYPRAAANLQLAHDLAARAPGSDHARP